MFLPILLLSLATLASAVLAYGTHPQWAQCRHGLEVVMLSRQLQWPLAALAILACLVVVALVVSGKRRAWWLIGLAPVLALLAHRFYRDPLRGLLVLDSPPFVTADKAGFLRDDEYVVGLVFNGTAYAYPYCHLYPAPVIVQADHDKRMVLIWSAFANRAVAATITRELRQRDLEVVSMPANALLVYNAKLGEFINGVTGLTHKGAKPTGFGAAIPVEKSTWAKWRGRHPGTMVLAPVPGISPSRMPDGPRRPWFPMPPHADPVPAETRVLMIPTTQPAALVARSADRPLSLVVGHTPVLIVPERQMDGVRVFDRRIDDLVLAFHLNVDRRRPKAYLVDVQTNSGWSADGRAVDGPLAAEHKRLAPIPADQGLWWGVTKFWFPSMNLISPSGDAEVRPPPRVVRPGAAGRG